ncbi:MAG: alpha/beta hydrolase [Catenulispora sp. 13_1_20CM_3_70_7]|nr:MAG: alpha/beta hydrolase [Catenulispora sp. 13_1_20CM_3_70_7]
MTVTGTRHWRSGVVLAAALAALAPIAAVNADAAPPSWAGQSSPHAPLPTIVLVHGAFADSSSWDATIAALQKHGYPVVAVANPLRGLSSDADVVRSVLATINGPVILVGHSYGGAVITNAARGAANVKALVYIGAFVPAQGESLATILPPAQFPGALLGPDTTDVRPVPNAVAPGGQDADITIKPADFRAVFAGDVPAFPAWQTLPSWDLITDDDKAIPPAGQRFMAARAHAHVESVDSSHAVMVSHPGAVVDIILDAARYEV